MYPNRPDGEDAYIVNTLQPVGGGPDDNDAQAGHLIATAITASAGHHGHSSPQGDVTPRGYTVHGTDPPTQRVVSATDLAGAVRTRVPGSQENSSTTIVMEGRYTRNGRGGPSEIVPALRSQMGGTGKGDSMPLVNGVRRLMPIECERLMGWPDDWTRWDADGNEIADSHRYRMCGNGVVAPVAEWIGHRLVRVDSLLA